MCICTYSIIVVVSVAVCVYVLLWCGNLRTVNVMPGTARPELNYSYKSINQAMHPCRGVRKAAGSRTILRNLIKFTKITTRIMPGLYKDYTGVTPNLHG